MVSLNGKVKRIPAPPKNKKILSFFILSSFFIFFVYKENKMTTSFHPLYVIGKTIKEAKEYFEEHQIKYNLQTSSKCYNFGGALSIHISYEIGTHFYKYYDYQIEEPKENGIIISFEGVSDSR